MFSSTLHWRNNCSVNPTCSIKSDGKGFRLIRFFRNEILLMSKFKFFVSRNKFSIIAKIFLKSPNVTHNWNIQKWKFSFEKYLKNWYAFGRRSWKIGTPSFIISTPLARWNWIFDTPLTFWHDKLYNWHDSGTLARLFVRRYLKVGSGRAFGTWARRPRWYAWHAWHVI